MRSCGMSTKIVFCFVDNLAKKGLNILFLSQYLLMPSHTNWIVCGWMGEEKSLSSFILANAERAWELVYTWARDNGHIEERHFGGYFQVWLGKQVVLTTVHVDMDHPRLIDVEFCEERMGLFRRCVTEKGRRAIDTDSISSWVNRDPDQEQYGGAIHFIYQVLGSASVFSFSGMPEEVDELLCIVTAMLCGFFNGSRKRELVEILQVSKNEVAIDFLKWWRPVQFNALRLD